MADNRDGDAGQGVPSAAPPPVQPYETSQPYGAPSYGPPAYAPARPTSNGLAIAALVVGIVSLVLGMVFPFFVVGSVVAVVLGHVSLSQIRKTGQRGKGMAVAGLVLGYVGIAMLVLIVSILALAFVF